MNAPACCPRCGTPSAAETPGIVCAQCLISSAAFDRAKQANEVPGFELITLIATGGMAEVHLADQLEPVRRDLAVKILKAGMDSREILDRFDAERQALALMDHPHIAHVFDAGVTRSGRPYFAMEFVEGTPITDWCELQRLSLRERLVLFVQVCRAVHHAHQKGIIHRDLKPSNILVSLRDNVAAPKVIDFGIAKAIQRRLLGRNFETGVGLAIGTPLYMSPEQAAASEDIDIRSDVYSLGVVLYELMTGVTPFDEHRADATAEVLRLVRTEDPPSMRSRRQKTPEKGLDFPPDVEWITQRCLEKEKVRRYDSAESLATDVERFLNNEAVIARGPSNWYRLKKFARRNRMELTSVAGIAIALIAGMAVSLWQAETARRAQMKAERLVKMWADMLAAPDLAHDGKDITVLQVLESAEAKIESELSNEEDLRIELSLLIANTYISLSYYSNAESVLRRTLSKIKNQNSKSDYLNRCMYYLGETEYQLGNMSTCLKTHATNLILMSSTLRKNANLIVQTLIGTANCLNHIENYSEAVDILKLAESFSAKYSTDTSESVATIHLGLANCTDMLGFETQALEYYKQSIAELRQSNQSANCVVAISLYASCLESVGYLDAAKSNIQSALSMQYSLYGTNSFDVPNILSILSRIERSSGNYQASYTNAQAALQLQSRFVNTNHYSLVDSLGNVAFALIGMNQPLEAEGYFERAINISIQYNGSNSGVTSVLQTGRARALAGLGRFEEAEQIALTGYEHLRSMFPAGDSRVVGALEGIRDVYRRQEEFGLTNPPPANVSLPASK